MGPFPPRVAELTLDQEQTSCLTSPLRQELFGAFLRLGPCSVDEIAKKTGHRAKSLYYHVELLERTGLVRKVGEQPTSKRPEAIYDAAANRVLFGEENTEEVRKSVQGLVRLVGRELARTPDTTNAAVVRVTTRLSKEDRDELVRRMEDLVQWAKARDDAQQERSSLSIFMVPL